MVVFDSICTIPWLQITLEAGRLHLVTFYVYDYNRKGWDICAEIFFSDVAINDVVIFSFRWPHEMIKSDITSLPPVTWKGGPCENHPENVLKTNISVS